jgi:Leucine-rich repeat (LRR) protein/glucose/arabinose dehydrogenase
MALLAPSAIFAADCEFVLGFKTLRDLVGHEIVGECLENQHHGANGDALQQTTKGLLAWRKADNWTAFTDGYRTWINGPNGLVQRLNTERFDWEADYVPGGGVATPAPTTPTAAVVLGDREVLVALYNATGGENWKNSGKWLSSAPIGEWQGVTVDAGGRVTELRLNRNQLSGEIPPELGYLTNLNWLYLQDNTLSGKIPAELGNLTNLKELWLENNRLGGEIPPELGSLANLTELRLHRNQLSGKLPPELGNLTKLRELWLDNNRLSGEIPPELGSLANLNWLYLQDNTLSGKIPAELGNLTNLKELWLENNRLGGEIPPELGSLANLTELRLHRNQLSGKLPPELGNLTKLRELWLDNNRLSGEIPPELGSLANLNWLYLQDNTLSGEIPPELGGLVNLNRLSLHWNRLKGEIPAEFGMLANLEELSLGDNSLSGEIPPELGNLTNLRELRLSRNQLSGAIPAELAQLANLERLWLHNNQLSGELPPNLVSLAKLTDLRVHGNQLSGEIPGSPVPVRVAPAVTAPRSSRLPLAVALQEAFGGLGFDQPVEIGVYPVGPAGSTGPGAFVAERKGLVLLVHPDGNEAVELLDITDRVSLAASEEGLLSVALDPRFEQNGHLWLYYSVLSAPRRTRLSRFSADLADLRRVQSDSEFVVMEIEKEFANHNGGSIRFGPDGMLYLGLGDGSAERNSQNLGTLLGSIIRIDVRESSEASPYAVPSDNPFVDVPGARPEIWAYGFRNPWRMSFDPATGVLWAADVGRSDLEEIDHVVAGGNYGWNRFEGTRCHSPMTGCDPTGTILPVVEYGHHLGCSITGGLVYRGKAIPALVGHYLFSDYCFGQLWALPPDGGEVVQIAASPRAVTSFGTDADGEVYVVTFAGGGAPHRAPVVVMQGISGGTCGP